MNYFSLSNFVALAANLTRRHLLRARFDQDSTLRISCFNLYQSLHIFIINYLIRNIDFIKYIYFLIFFRVFSIVFRHLSEKRN